MSNQQRFEAENGLDGDNKTITNVADPVNAQDVATKNFTVSAISDAISGEMSGNAATATTASSVTSATFNTALTVETGSVTLVGNAANNSVLTLGAGASSVSGINTGDQTITLTGAVTGSGTGSFATTLTNTSVTGQALTGFNAGAGTVSASDSILSALQKIAGNVNLLNGSIVYQGTWNASTNTPTLTSGSGTKGWLYKVSVAGTTTVDGVSSWSVGDSIVFDGTTWDKIDGSPTEVSSVAGRTGAVTLAQSDIIGLKTTDSPTFAAVTATTFTGAFVGNASTSTTAGNVTGTVAIANGGTGQTSAAAALSALGGVSLSSSNTYTSSQTFQGSSSTVAVVLQNAAEIAQYNTSAPGATQNMYLANGSYAIFTASATNNFVLNIAWSASSSFNSVVPAPSGSVAEVVSLTVEVYNGLNPYYLTGISIDGTALVPGTNLFWANNNAPSQGNANGYDRYTISILKTADHTYLVKAAQVQY